LADALTETARLSIEQRDGRTVLAFAGRLDAHSIGPLWRRAIRSGERARSQPLQLDLSGVTFCDVAGAAFLAAVEAAHGAAAQATGATAPVMALLARARTAGHHPDVGQPAVPLTAWQLIVDAWQLLAANIAFIGEGAVALARLAANRRMLRLPDLLRYVDQAGVRSLPLVILLGYLIGLILAFQSAIPMRRFGADLYVANLVAISLLRELGPLLAAVILAGRTGSAFAAEIGTMKVNEEIDALRTMGLDPMTMLVLPRMITSMLVIPVMTLVLELAGLLGMTTVLRGFGFPIVAIAKQIQNWVTTTDLYGGLFKSVCFGMAVAAIGCRAGLSTGVGPRAVGLSATEAVVGGIVVTIVLDGVFALIFYRLNL
jgi:phospholipid/cholesterol/gamma-HCH transport system permease protein